MKRLIVVTALLSLSLSAPAFATCPTPPSPSGFYAYNYSQDEACYSLTGTISSTSVACYTGSGWSFGGPDLSYAVASFTVDGSSLNNANNWTGSSFIYFDSPGASSYDFIELIAVVTHNNADTRYSLFYWDGTMGSLNGCNEHYGTFSAVAGDTVSIKIYVGNSGSANIQASIPRVFNSL